MAQPIPFARYNEYIRNTFHDKSEKIQRQAVTIVHMIRQKDQNAASVSKALGITPSEANRILYRLGESNFIHRRLYKDMTWKWNKFVIFDGETYVKFTPIEIEDKTPTAHELSRKNSPPIENVLFQGISAKDITPVSDAKIAAVLDLTNRDPSALTRLIAETQDSYLLDLYVRSFRALTAENTLANIRQNIRNSP